jgi:hypothetical protein
MKTWSAEEVRTLIENYGKVGKEELLALLPNKTWKAIMNKANRLGSNKPRRKLNSFFAPQKIGLISHDDLLYLAGLFDGEGSFVLHRKKGRLYGYAPCITITNTSKELIEWVSKTLCTPYTEVTINKRKQANWKTAYRIGIRRVLDIKVFLEQIIPFLKAKRRQAELLLEFCTYELERKWNEAPPRIKEIYQELKRLNSKGINSKATESQK